MTDFHTHILPNIDDGSQSIEESLQMIDSLAAQGVRNIVLTPHYYPDKHSVDDFLKVRDQKVTSLRLAAADKNINLFAGSEVYLSKLLSLKMLDKLAIENTRYILVELPFSKKISKDTFAIIDNIVDYAGLTPIIAHAERYSAILSEPYNAKILISLGCLLQVNVSSLYTSPYKRLAYKLMDKDQVHIIGSDAHNLVSRPPIYKKPSTKIINRLGKNYYEGLQRNMQSVLENKTVYPNNNIVSVKRLLGLYY